MIVWWWFEAHNLIQMPTTKWDLILKGKQYGQKVEKTSAGVDAAQWTNLFYFLTRSEYHLIWNNHTPYAYLKMFLFNSSYKRKSSMKWRAPIIITSNWRIMQVECRIIRCVRFTFWVLPLKSHQFFFFSFFFGFWWTKAFGEQKKVSLKFSNDVKLSHTQKKTNNKHQKQHSRLNALSRRTFCSPLQSVFAQRPGAWLLYLTCSSERSV